MDFQHFYHPMYQERIKISFLAKNYQIKLKKNKFDSNYYGFFKTIFDELILTIFDCIPLLAKNLKI